MDYGWRIRTRLRGVTSQLSPPPGGCSHLTYLETPTTSTHTPEISRKPGGSQESTVRRQPKAACQGDDLSNLCYRFPSAVTNSQLGSRAP